MKFNGLDCILLVDDDRHTNFFHQLVIEEAEVEAHVEPLLSGDDALAFLTRSGKYATCTDPQPGIIFLDINMPGMDGFDFIEEYKTLAISEKPTSIVVMLTTSLNPRDKDRALKNDNIVAFLNKPLTVESVTAIASSYYPSGS